MAGSGYLYRRSSGIYVVRICVPVRLRPIVGRGEIHVSTSVRDAATAKATAFRVLSQWQERLLELDGMDFIKVIKGSPLLAGKGFVRLNDVANELGVEFGTLLIEITNNRVSLFCLATGWRGSEIADVDDIERDTDGSFIINSVSLDQSRIFTDHLGFFDSRLAAQAFIESGEYIGEFFFCDEKRRRLAFFDPGQKVGIESLLLLKTDAERIRLTLKSAVTPDMLRTAKALGQLATRSTSHLAPAMVAAPAPTHKYGALLASALLAKFLSGKKADWKPDHYRRMSSDCGVFVELMNDPRLDDIDRSMVTKYRQQLQTLPENLYQARRRHGVTSLADLAKTTSATAGPHFLQTTADRYIGKLSEMLNWAVSEELLPRNPAAGFGGGGKRDKREQDERGIFDHADLAEIFGVVWFRDGKGTKSKRGRFQNYQPHFYWLPLLGIYSGGRLNELAQLYLDDLSQDESGCWYLDFNLVEPSAIEGGSSVEIAGHPSKSLKTVNSRRVVALHHHLIELGLPDYVQALRDAGYDRLFPELHLDKVKGYGKAPGSWFNGRFLKGRLGMARDGTKTFHSFRHMFVTGLFDAEVPEVTVAQLAGHERGETMSGKRYRKDQDASKLRPYIDLLDFNLPAIASFDIASGLSAVRDALDRKRRHHSKHRKTALIPV